MNLNWNLLDLQWRDRHDETQLEALESALDKALYNQGQERDYALLWRWARLSHFRAMKALHQSETEHQNEPQSQSSEMNTSSDPKADVHETEATNGDSSDTAVPRDETAMTNDTAPRADAARDEGESSRGGESSSAGEMKSSIVDKKARAAAREAARLHFAAGAHEAFEAARLQPNRVEGHFWAGVNAIEAARLAGTIATARALSGASRHIERAARIDETYHFAAPLRVSGRITHLRPMILGGSLDLAIDLLRRAHQIAPQNSTTLLYLAQALRADRQPAEARIVLRQLVQAPPDPDWRWEQERDKNLARVLLLPQQ